MTLFTLSRHYQIKINKEGYLPWQKPKNPRAGSADYCSTFPAGLPSPHSLSLAPKNPCHLQWSQNIYYTAFR
jgi:hypothetical protein